MEYSETETNIKALNEFNTDDSEDSLEKLDDEQFIRFLENNYKGLQKSHEDLDNEWIQQGQENSLLWEKSFEHSILLEVDDDFNLNFTEVHDSYTICLSQSSAEDVNITSDDISNIESEHSFDDDKASSIDERQYDYSQDIQSPRNSNKYSEPKGSLMQNLECIFFENRVQDVPDNSTDEEQEELPYDSNLQITNHHPADTIADLDDHRIPLIIGKTRQNDGPDCGMARILAKNEQSNVETALYQKEMTYTRVSPEAEDSGRNKIGATDLTSEDNGNSIVSEHEMKLEHNKRGSRRSNIAESLLRHFSEEDLALSSTKYIDTETLPETSFTETIEETVIKKQILSVASNNSPTGMQEFVALEADLSKKRKVHEFTNENKVSKDYSYCDRSVQGQVADLLQTNNNCRENQHGEIQEENENLQFSPKTASRFFEKFKMGKIISYNEIKYGKGQPLYPIPDFSKVAPKIKIPKTSSSNKYIPSKRKKEKSSSYLSYPLTSHTSTVDVVQDVLDSLQPRIISTNTAFNKQEFLKGNHSPELFQQLQEEFDKLLIKYAEAENTIDQLRFGAKVSILTDSTRSNQIIHSGMSTLPCQTTTLAKQGQLGLSSDSVFLGSVCNNIPTPLSVDYGVITSASCSPNTEMNETTEAEQMAQKLNKHIDFFKHQVKEFEENLNSNTVSVENQQKVFKQMRDDQEQLERSYITAKEEHRSLQQRHYLEQNTSIGEFDPDREIEGDIFRLGMHLESVKDKIDDNICNQPSPFNSFSTSTPLPPSESLSAGYALYSESPMAAINREGLKLTFETSSVSTEIPNSIEFKMIPEMDSQPSLLEHSYDHILQQDLYKHPNTLAHALDFSVSESTLNSPCWMKIKKGEGCRTISGPVVNIYNKQTEWDPKLMPHIEHSKTMSTLTEGYFHSTEFFPDLSMNQTLPLPNTSSQAQDLLTEYKQQILSPDSGCVGSESCRPPTSKQILDSEQPKTERDPSVWEETPDIERQKSSSSHRSESLIGIDEDKASCLLHLANPSSCSFPFNCVGVTDIPAKQGKSVLLMDLHHESSEDLMPLPNIQQCMPKIPLWKSASSTEESQDLSQKWAAANDKIMILQNEVLKLKQKLEENLSKLPSESTRKKCPETALREQRYKNKPHLNNKCSSAWEDVRLLSTNSKHHRRFCRKTDDIDDVSDIELNTCHHNVTLSTAQAQLASCDEYIQPCHLCIARKIHLPSFSPNGHKLYKTRINPSPPCRKNIHCEHSSERSSQHSKDGFPSNVRISPPGANKYTDLPANILPIRYDSTKCSPNTRDSRMYNSSSCKMVKKQPKEITRTKSLLISNIDKNIENSQVSNLNETLDRAIETAKHMKKTTRRMVKVLSADLATAEYYKYLNEGNEGFKVNKITLV